MNNDNFYFFGHSRTGELARKVDWNKTSLGNVDKWQSELKTILGMMFNNGHPMCLFWGEEHIFFFNDRCIPILGRIKEPWAMGSRGDKVWAEAWHILIDQIAKSESGNATWNEDQNVPIEDDNGKLRDAYFTYSYSPIFLANGAVGGTLCTCTETTKRILVERENIRAKEEVTYALEQVRKIAVEMERSRVQLYDFFMQTPIPLVVLEGPDHRYVLANPPYEKMTSRKIMIGKTVLENFSSEEVSQFIPLLDSVYNTGIPYVGTEIPLSIPDEKGETHMHWISVGYHPHRDASGRIIGVLAVHQDVTSQVEARKKLEIHLGELGEERDLRERFVLALSHDLRTPLTSAKMGTQMLVRKISDPLDIKIFSKIDANLNRADSMITDLLDANRIKAGEKIPLYMQECDLVLVVKKTAEELTTLHGNRFDLKVSGDFKGRWDPSAIRRVIENLVNNAVKYGTAESPITIFLNKSSSMYEIGVHNEGNPISIEEQKYIFEPFQRSEEAKSSLQKGWGIGLTLVRGLADSFGGKAILRSSESEGTTFSIIIPIK